METEFIHLFAVYDSFIMFVISVLYWHWFKQLSWFKTANVEQNCHETELVVSKVTINISFDIKTTLWNKIFMDNLTFPETAQKLGTRYLTESFIVFLENLNENTWQY